MFEEFSSSEMNFSQFLDLGITRIENRDRTFAFHPTTVFNKINSPKLSRYGEDRYNFLISFSFPHLFTNIITGRLE